MIDYLTVMLVNLVAGLVTAAVFLIRGWFRRNNQHWATAFGLIGVVAAATGLHMTLTWPLGKPLGWANIAFGESALLLGAVFLGVAVSLGKGWKLWPVGLYSLPAGGFAIVAGLRILDLGRTKAPELSAAGFILAGLGGVLLLPVLLMPRQRWLHYATAVVLLAAAGIWALTGYASLWAHIESFAGK